jgi:hypothetical protein
MLHVNMCIVKMETLWILIHISILRKFPDSHIVQLYSKNLKGLPKISTYNLTTNVIWDKAHSSLVLVQNMKTLIIISYFKAHYSLVLVWAKKNSCISLIMLTHLQPGYWKLQANGRDHREERKVWNPEARHKPISSTIVKNYAV